MAQIVKAERAGWVGPAKWAAGIVVWLLQYAVWAPMAIFMWVVIGVVKVGGVTALLLFVPVIGWILLVIIVMMRRGNRAAERRHQETLAALAPQYQPPSSASGPSFWLQSLKPWGLAWVRS